MENKLVHMHDIVSKAHAVAKDNMLVRSFDDIAVCTYGVALHTITANV